MWEGAESDVHDETSSSMGCLGVGGDGTQHGWPAECPADCAEDGCVTVRAEWAMGRKELSKAGPSP